MKNKRWSKKDIDYLIKNYPKTHIDVMMEELSMDKTRIQKKAFRMKIKVIKSNTKDCCKCKKTYPKTLEYFFQKEEKQKTKNGIKTYYGLRHICKNCYADNTRIKKQQKRCEELNCDIGDYQKLWRNIKYNAQKKYPETIGLSKNKRRSVIRKMNNGYAYTTYTKYKKDCSLTISLARRKYDYYDKTKLVDNKLGCRVGIINLTDGYIAMTLGFKVKDVPKEIIETKRLYLQLKREIGETNLTTTTTKTK